MLLGERRSETCFHGKADKDSRVTGTDWAKEKGVGEAKTTTSGGDGFLTSVLVRMVCAPVLLAVLQNARPQRRRVTLGALPFPRLSAGARV